MVVMVVMPEAMKVAEAEATAVMVVILAEAAEAMVLRLMEKVAVAMASTIMDMAETGTEQELLVFALSLTPSKNPKNNPNKRR